MSPEPTTSQICPTCGTRLSETASRCLVCGTEITPSAESKSSVKTSVQGSRMPSLTLSLPAALGLFVLFIVIGAILVFLGLRATGTVAVPTQGPTPSNTATVTVTPSETPTSTTVPSPTEQPPQEYTIASGDTCTSIALFYKVSVQSIITLNNLPVACNTLFIGQKIKVPFPTPTPPPVATATLEPAEATRAACDKVEYTVQSGDTLAIIANTYQVSQEAIKEFNGLTTDTVYIGTTILVPLCKRAATPGPTPTPTIPPPYPAPSLLLPADGKSFTLADDTITLQWASVGTLRDNEAYQVVVEDVTEGQGRKLIDYAKDTKYIVPSTFRPNDSVPHVMRWYVIPVRQGPTDEQGNPTWLPGGAKSLERVFSWMSVSVPATPVP
jgi:LysM repeat protein